jgi:lipopolysaccharide/colanic/teichoic acid biosynthesis glycosyltransferase
MHRYFRPSSPSTRSQKDIRTGYAPVHPAAWVTEETGGLVQQETGDRALVVSPCTPRVLGFYGRFGKRLLDLTSAILLSALLLPLLVVIGIALWISMGPPVVFRQQRVGLNGQTFTILKFRTMLPDRRKSSAGYMGRERRKAHKSPNDPRVTLLGRFLRKWSLDELPQLWNVLRGDMSLVGPRPELLSIVQRYELWQHQRHAVKPGLTGLWQISRRRDGLMHEHIELDIEYIDNLSFRADLRIMLNTIPAVLSKEHGY